MDYEIEEIIKIANQKSSYRVVIILLAALIWATDLINMSLSYLETMPEIEYLAENGVTINATLTYEICKRYKWSIKEGCHHSWVYDLNIVCDELKTGLLGTFAYFGSLLGGLMMQFSINYFGFRRSIIVSAYIYIGFLLSYFFISNIYIVFILLTLTQFFSNVYTMNVFILVCESCTTHYRSFSGGLINAGYSLGAVLQIYLFMRFDSWKVAMGANVFLLFILIALFNMTFVESPILSISKGKLEDFFLSLSKIAKFNNCEESFNYLVIQAYRSNNQGSTHNDTKMLHDNINNQTGTVNQEQFHDPINTEENRRRLEQIVQRLSSFMDNRSEIGEKDYTIIDIFKYTSQIKTFLILNVIWFCSVGLYYGLSINIKNLPGDVYISGMIVYLCEGSLNIMCCFLINTIGRKGMIQTSLIISLTGLCLLSLFDLPSYLVTICSLGSKLFMSSEYNTLFTYTSELYPSKLRPVGYGCNLLVGCLGSMIFPVLLETMKDNIYMIFFVSSLVCFFSVCFLPETNGRPLQNHIPEETRNKGDGF